MTQVRCLFGKVRMLVVFVRSDDDRYNLYGLPGPLHAATLYVGYPTAPVVNQTAGLLVFERNATLGYQTAVQPSLNAPTALSNAGFLCERYAQMCGALLNSLGCTSQLVYGCGSPGGPAVMGSFDQFFGFLRMSGAVLTSMCRARGSDKSCGSESCNVAVVMLMTPACCMCSAAIFAPSVVATSPSAIIPAGGATPFDFRATFSAVCDAAMSRLSCPAGSVIMSNVGSLASPFTCQCGASANAPARVSKNIIDAVIQTRNDAAAPAGATNFLCTRYVANCIAFMRVSGCTSYTVTGCGGGGSFGRLDNFSNVCQCNAPFILTDPSSRLAQLLVDARLYAQVRRVPIQLRRFLVHQYIRSRPQVSNLIIRSPITGTVNLSATYVAACAYALGAVGCPTDAFVVNSGFSAGVIDTSACACGTFDIKKHVAEVSEVKAV